MNQSESFRLTDVSPKETAIFEAVFRLLDERRDFHALTVADIAAAAGIGKGTVYEYFSSKDEILSRAIVYQLERSLARCRALFERLQGFDEIFCALLDETAGLFTRAGAGSWHLLTALVRRHPEGFGEPCGLCARQRAENIYSLCDRLAERGRAEGIVRAGLEPDYLHFAFNAAFFAFIQRIKCEPGGAGHTVREAARRHALALFRAAVA